MSTSATTAADYFGSMIESYDSLIRRAVPRYEEMTQRLMAYLPASADSVLELGCGTGNLSLRLAERYPRARLTLVDAAPEMIIVTQSRVLKSFPAAAKLAVFRVKRFEEISGDDGPFDVITSCISLHHVKDKLRLYRHLHEALAPGGTFRFADQMAGAPGTHNGEINWNKWLEFCREPAHCTEQEIQSLVDHAEAHDFYTSVAEHLHHLESAGFVNVDCVWRNWMWGIVTAERKVQSRNLQSPKS